MYDPILLNPKEFLRGSAEVDKLSLRKNLKAGFSRLCRHYYVSGSKEVIFMGSLKELLKKTEEECERYHYGWLELNP